MAWLIYRLVQALVLVQILHPAASLSFWQTRPTDTKTRIPENCRILILPGFGNASEDYTKDGSLVSSLRQRGWSENQIDVLPVERTDWLQVFLRGALDLEFWKANAPPSRPAFKWYLDRIAQQISTLEEDESMILLGHSAGGWLARAAVGFGSEETNTNDVLSIH
jgi:pimeloyl-ACP methyl ester carboxylesterase